MTFTHALYSTLLCVSWDLPAQLQPQRSTARPESIWLGPSSDAANADRFLRLNTGLACTNSFCLELESGH